MSTQHVPAWKRLGLKLKFANESIASASLNPEGNSEDKKRKHDADIPSTNGLEGQQHQLKRARVENGLPRSKLSRNIHGINAATLDHDGPKRKKSVTFTPDTKDEDGSTAQTIQFWVPDSPGSTPKKPSKLSDDSEPTDPKKRPKKEKKPKSQRLVSSVPQRKGVAALNYLNQFHRQRSEWKFNKNHDTWIMKNILSDDHIPQEYILSLASYLRGLKSKSAKDRLVEQSREALKVNGAATQQERDAEEKLLHAIEASSSGMNDQDTTSWVQNLGRPVLILLSLGQSLDGFRETGSMSGPVPRVKKNKSRTTRIEIESSSSSGSDSESDNDDEKDDNRARPALGFQASASPKKGQSANEIAEETSSYESSSADSSTDTTDDDTDNDTSSDEESDKE